ncbi:MAG TPA: hypothetical protein VFW19_01135 [Allosphingosinicella sp.]|nr:hypothetical protein [Allosphingosinicella sp.]
MFIPKALIGQDRRDHARHQTGQEEEPMTPLQRHDSPPVLSRAAFEGRSEQEREDGRVFHPKPLSIMKAAAI